MTANAEITVNTACRYGAVVTLIFTFNSYEPDESTKQTPAAQLSCAGVMNMCYRVSILTYKCI